MIRKIWVTCSTIEHVTCQIECQPCFSACLSLAGLYTQHGMVSAYTYTTKKVARKAYAQVQGIMNDALYELSVHRFLLPADHQWYVVVIGKQPDQGLHKRLEATLAMVLQGNPVSLNQDILTMLLEKHTQQLQTGASWQKKHSSEVIAARAMEKRATVLKTYKVETRQLEEASPDEYWVFLIISLEFVTVELPIGHLTDESLARDYGERRRTAMIEAILDHQAVMEEAERS